MSLRRHSSPLKNWEMMVARAAPPTPVWNSPMKVMSKITFRTEQKIRYFRGFFPSPTACITPRRPL